MAEPEPQSLDELAAEADAMEEAERDLLAQLDAVTAERDEFKDRFMRALADAENARKRADRDRREAEQYGGSKLARDMLPVFDALKRALDAANEEIRAAAPALFEGAPEGAFSLNRVYDRAMENGRLFGLVHDGVWFHLSTPEDLNHAEETLRAGLVRALF